jgi:hypothetical protein
MTTMLRTSARAMPRWPLFLIASPAAVAVWSGWVGLGGMCGFGIIHPLPGIADGFRLNTAITLPIGVEAYGAYALGAWLTPGVPARVRAFAQWSAIGALTLGMAGQVIFHLLAAAHQVRAPWPVVTFVSCLPVVALAFGAALTHLLRTGSRTDSQGRTEAELAEAARDAALSERDAAREHARQAEEQLDAARQDVTRAGAQHERLAEELASAREELAGLRRERDAQGRKDSVDRAAIVAELAEELRDAIEAGERWRPDYPALMARTGYRRSWCEKAVRDARAAVLPANRTDTDAEHPDDLTAVAA